MPIVPSVQESALPTTRFSTSPQPIADTADSYKAASGLADVAGAIADKEQKSANDAKILDIDSQLTNFKNDQLWNKDYGAFQQRGENALNVVETYGQKFKDKQQALYQSLNNEDQRAMFNQRSAQIGDEFRLDLEKHTYTEGKKLEDESYKTAQDAYFQDTALNYQSPGKVAQNLSLIEGLVRSKASKDGISDPTLVNTLVDDAKSKLHAGVIERASNNGQDQFASAYFNKVKGELGDKLIPVEKTLEEASTLGNAQRNRDAIISTPGMNLSDALDQVRKIKDAKQQAKTDELVKQYYSEQAQAKEQAQKQLKADVFNNIDSSSLQGIARYNALPASTKASLNPEAKVEAQNYAEKTNEPAPNGDSYQHYLYLLKNPDTRDSVVLDPKLKLEMRSSEFKELTDLSTKDPKTTDKLDYLWPIEKAKRDAVSTAGLSGWFSNGTASDVIQFNSSFDQAIKQKELAAGRNLTSDDASSVANTLVAKVVTSKRNPPLWKYLASPIYGFTSKGEIPVGALNSDSVDISDIPYDIKDQIVAGRSLSDQQVIRAYIKGLQLGVIKPNAQ